jgi:hypothetical protein
LHELIVLLARRKAEGCLIAPSFAKACRRKTAASLEKSRQVLLIGEATGKRYFGDAAVGLA